MEVRGMATRKYKYANTYKNIPFVKRLAKDAPMDILKGQLEASKKKARSRKVAHIADYHKMVVNVVSDEIKKRK